MTSLAEVYEDHVGGGASPRQLYAGVGLFLAGTGLVVAGIVIATTDVLSVLGVPAWRAWEPAGVLAGLGLPAVFVGIFIVLPASREVRAAAAVGASVAVLGVALFEHAYPTRWMGNDPNLTPLVATVYFLGTITTFWCLFIAVANFKTRNDPGGTVEVEITRGGETRVVEVARDAIDGEIPADAVAGAGEGRTGAGGVGLLGETPDGEVATQTNRVEERTAGAVRSTGGGTGRSAGGDAGRSADGGAAPGSPKPASDGGATEPGVRTPADDAEVMHAGSDPRDAADAYCGSCEHFRYVSTSRGMRPFCDLQDGLMDDMDACEEWSPNRLE